MKTLPVTQDTEPHALKTVGPNGKASDSRLRSASQAYEVARELDNADKKRRLKRGRIYKAYNRFPPTEYSKLAKDGSEWKSNVNFGMMAFVVDNSIASFYDMLSERTEAAEIVTKEGNTKEKKEWSEGISIGFNRVLEKWDDYLFNQEQDLLDMHLYGKGVEMWHGVDGFSSKHLPVDDLLVPDSTKINLSNFDVVAVRWDFQLYELYQFIKDQESAEHMGWNVGAVVEAMRAKRKKWRRKTHTQFLEDIKNGNVAITSHIKDTVSTYIVYIREFDGKVSKHIVLQDYAKTLSSTRGKIFDEGSDEFNNMVDDMGFLFTKTGMFENYRRVFSVFMDNTGSGFWHNTPSLAEKIFVACRQYDFTMNRVMDAISINMSLILKGSTAETTQKLKEIEFGPFTILPADVECTQHRMELPVTEATGALQFLMLDMNRGIGNYRIHEKGTEGEAPTATQSQLDATEAAKLTGTQLRRFNSQHTIYYTELYRRLVSLTPEDDDYELFKEFRDLMDELNIPKKAWEYESIESIKSNMLSGAGSPSYKLMAAQQTIAFTNVAPKDEGQANAVRDAIAALNGRQNVDRYVPKDVKPDPTWNERVIGIENESFESPICNPQNVMVYPKDNHVEHITLHLNDLARTLQLCQQAMQQGKPDKDEMKAAATKMLNGGGHINAHMEFLQRDTGKKDQYKQFQKDLDAVKRQADQLAQQFQEMMKSQAEGATGDLENDPEMRKKLAIAQIEIDTKQKLAQISIGAKATSHQQRMEIDKEKASNQIAIERAKSADKLKTNSASRRGGKSNAA